MKKYLLIFSIAISGAFLFHACGNAETSDTAKAAADMVGDKVGDAVKAVQVVNAEPGYKVGDKASDFKLKNIDGENYSLASLKEAKGYIVTFTCNSCPYSVMYEDRLIALHKKYEAMGYPVVAINPNDPEVKPADSFDKMIQRSKDKAFPFLYLFDENQEVYPAFGASRTPHVFILDKDLVVQYIGAIDDNAKDADAVKVNYVENAITSLEKGTKPNPDFTKAIGCSIKTKKS